MDLQYKAIKNPDRPGRAPKGCVWVKDAAGKIISNEQGQYAYRAAQPGELKPKKAKGVRKKSARAASRKVKADVPAIPAAALLKKRSYKELSFDDLAKVKVIAQDLMDQKKASEKAALEAELNKIQEKLRSLS